MKDTENCFTLFENSIQEFVLPEYFTNPFDYEPHPLCLLAVKELQAFLVREKKWEHNFGLIPNKGGVEIGKMFGVLIVQNSKGRTGYLSAFSGTLTGTNPISRFVPSIFNPTEKEDFLTKGMLELNALSGKIANLHLTPEMIKRNKIRAKQEAIYEKKLHLLKKEIATATKSRSERLKKAESTLEPKVLNSFKKAIKKEMQREDFQLKKLAAERESEIQTQLDKTSPVFNKIEKLKTERKNKSIALQERLFSKYHFLNQKGESKSLKEIFTDTVPMSGAGECAAPKLLQYAFENNLKIIAMAEFWWGKTGKSEVMKHQNFYPACQEKCVPILGHMLEGVELEGKIVGG